VWPRAHRYTTSATTTLNGTLIVITLRRSLTLLVLIAALSPLARADDRTTAGPWNLTELFQAPKYEWEDQSSPVRSLLFENEPYNGHPTRVFTYYATPGTLAGDTSTDKNLPAVVLVHGGGGTAFREWCELWAKRGYAAIAPDLAGNRPLEGSEIQQRDNRIRLADGGPDQQDAEKFFAIGEPLTQQWEYHAIAAVLRAHSLIRSFLEVDAERTAVTGISWGGYLTCITAGIDSRFKAAVPVYGCGYLYENSAWLDQFAKLSPEHRDLWIKLWEPSQYLPHVSMPVLFVNGTNDFAYPLDSYMKSFDAVPDAVLKQFCITVNMPHSHPAGWAPPEIGAFIDHVLLGKPGLARLGEIKTEGNVLRVAYTGDQALQRVQLHYTTGSEAINMRAWESHDGTVAADYVETPAPPENATAYFITVTDDRGAVTSTGVVLRR
jgi:dienelactone hydrolase